MGKIVRIEKPVEVHYKTQKVTVPGPSKKRSEEEREALKFKGDRVTLGGAPEIPTYDRKGRPAGARIVEDTRRKTRNVLGRE